MTATPAQPMAQPDQPVMELAPEFLEIAACPACHSQFAVDYDTSELTCTNINCGLAFPVRNNIPVLLIDEARNPLGN